MRAPFFCLTFLLFAQPLAAQSIPAPGPGDARLQTVMYDPEQVVQLPVSAGYQLMVSFQAGEQIETIAVGNSNAWQVTANKRGDFLFVKSIVPSAATNMTIVTDVRIYNFELLSSTNGEGPFSVRFLYADPVNLTKAGESTSQKFRYKISGTKAIRPASIIVEGNRVSIQWPEGSSLPAIFRVEDNGQEAVVNGEMQDGLFVIEGVPQKLVFRVDEMKATATRATVRRGRP